MVITHQEIKSKVLQNDPPSAHRPYEGMPLAELIEQTEFQYEDGNVSFELLSELIQRAQSAEAR